MPNVTQTVPNYLGGVSRQPDTKKLPGQVVDAINAYPDPTFGLTKRPGFKFLKNLGNENIYANAKWFYIHRDGDEKYIGCIKGTAIYIWNATSGVQATVTYTSNANTSYLTGTTANDYDVLTVQDTTLITNKTKTVTTQAAPSFTANTVGTVRLRAVTVGTTYSVTVNGSTVTYTTPNDSASADTILTNLKNSIDGLSISGLTVTRLDTTLELSGSSAFTLSGKGGVDNERLETFQNQVANVTQLPDRSINHRVVKVLNTASADDTYYARFKADNGTSGVGYWEEFIAPDVSPGLTASTMPHELVNTATNTFTFREATYTARLVGDDTTQTLTNKTLTTPKIAEIDSLSSGSITLDAEANIELNADGGTITFADAGASLGTITSSGYSGNAATATVATTVTITDNESTNEDNAIVFTAGGDVDGGNLGLESDGDLTYNPSTGKLTATQLAGTQAVFVGKDASITDDTATGVVATMTALTGVSIGELVHIDGNGKIDQAHADATADMPAIGIALEANNSGSDADIKVLLQGFYKDADQFNFTVGTAVFADHSGEGNFTQSASTTDGHFIQRVGIALTADTLYFSPSLDVIERD